MSERKEVLKVEELVIRFGGLCAINNINVHVDEGDFVGLIGPNGAGKTTFFNSITGNLVPTSGRITFQGKSLMKKDPAQISHMGISRTFQNIRIFPKMSVLENVSLPLHSKPTYNVFSAILGLPSAKKEDSRIQNEALEFLSCLGIESYKDQEAGTLAYGLQRRLEIARALATNPKLLLLDEPAAGMNPEETLALMEISKAMAFLNERNCVFPEDVKRVFPYIVRHRISLTARAKVEKLDKEELVSQILNKVKIR